MISLLLAAGLTVVSAANASSSSPSSWSCAYVAERLPQRLAVLGDETVSAEETRAERRRLSLSAAVLTRASNLTLARSLGATRLVVVRCFDQGKSTAIEAQAFDTERPVALEMIRLAQPAAELPAVIDLLARRLSREGTAATTSRPPSAHALAAAGPALSQLDVYERARGLIAALNRDPTCFELRLSTTEAHIGARDFDAAIRIAATPPGPGVPEALVRLLRFQFGIALLEAGRYAEAKTVLETLSSQMPTAAVLNNLGVALFRLRNEAASEVLERASFLPDHRQHDIAFNRSLTLMFEGRAAEALTRLDASIRAGSSDVRTILLRVWALRLLNREAEREKEWQRLMAIAPSFSALGSPDRARRLERIFRFERKP